MRRSTAGPRGFTLIEVLVALLVMATMAVIAWRGIDALLKSRDIAQTHLDRSALLQTVLAQWELDLRALQDSQVVEPLSFDGASMRLTRQQPLGLQVVAWTLRDGRLYRWEGPVQQSVAALQQSFEQSQQFLAQDSRRLLMLEDLDGWQLYCYRGNSWSNCLSSDNVTPPQAGGPQRAQLPTGVRMVLEFAPRSGFAGPLTRQIIVGPQS